MNIHEISRYSSYDKNGKELFIGMRDGIIKIYPKTGGVYTEEIEKIAEQVAFTQTDIIIRKINEIVDKKLESLISEIDSKIDSAMSTVMASIPVV